MSTDTQLYDVLKRHKLSSTKSRQLVFDTLKLRKELSMAELCSALIGDIDRATIYRIVDTFEKIGVIHRINIGWKYKLELSDQFRPHHHHLQCEICGKLIDIDETELLKIEKHLSQVAKAQKFELRSHQLELSGLCETCSR